MGANVCGEGATKIHVKRLWLISAVPAGLVTGILALTGHSVAVALHAIGGIYAIGMIGVAAYRARSRSHWAVVGVMTAANVTGVVWTVFGETSIVIVIHVLVGIMASAGVLFLAIPSHEPDTHT